MNTVHEQAPIETIQAVIDTLDLKLEQELARGNYSQAYQLQQERDQLIRAIN